MAPTRSKKRKSDESTNSLDIRSFPTPPKLIPTKTQSPVRTPTNRSPIRKPKMRITVAQKQALIDNLQLEITERARKLRAQYMLQAQGLRTRIEIRVNRIPVALRREKMGDLLLKHSGNITKTAPTTSMSPAKVKTLTKNLMSNHSNTRANPSPQPKLKRHSDEMVIGKENEDVENPKKRTRKPVPAARMTSQNKVPTSQVLSPRSANSRTLHVSPIRPVATGKNAPASVAAGVGRGRRAAAPPVLPKVTRARAISNSSDGSNATIVRKPVPITKKAAPAPRKTVMSTIRGIGGGTKRTPAPRAATGDRVLRKRN